MEAGQLSNFELIQQQTRLYEVRSIELQYQAALNKAITELWLATGTVLDNLGVVYEDTVDERKLWERVTQPPPLAKPYLEKAGPPDSAKVDEKLPAPPRSSSKSAPKSETKSGDSAPQKAPLFGPRKRPWEK